MNGIDEEGLLDNSYSISVGKNFDQEHYDCDKCKSIFADEKNLDSHHCGGHEENEPNLVSSDVCEVTFECDKCDVVFVDKTDLRTHMNQYHEVLKQCRFCPFKASLAEMLEHVVLNYEDEEKEVTNDDIEEVRYHVIWFWLSAKFLLVKK